MKMNKKTRKRTIRWMMAVDRQQDELAMKTTTTTTTKKTHTISSTMTSSINSSINSTTNKRKWRSSSRAVFSVLAVSMIVSQLWMIQRARYHHYETMKLSSSSTSSSSPPSFLSPLEIALKQSFFWSQNRHHISVAKEEKDNKDPTERHRHPFHPVNMYPSGINSSSIDWHQPNLVGPEPALPSVALLSSTISNQQSSANRTTTITSTTTTTKTTTSMDSPSDKTGVISDAHTVVRSTSTKIVTTTTTNATNSKRNSQSSSVDEEDTVLHQLQKLKEEFQLKQMQQSSLFKQYKDPLTDPSFNTSLLQLIDWNRIRVSNTTESDSVAATAVAARKATTTTPSHIKPNHPSSRSSHDGGGHLGVLLDAGRHYFSIEWIKRMIDVISKMGYDMIHFRLTDDQAFNIQLQSQPLLAYPSRLDGNIKVYQPQELKDIVQYAKHRGITIIPEINVPGHAGAWGGVPDLIIKCPNFICTHGYGVLLNLSQTNLPTIRQILFDVLTEVIEIFDHPPYLHLGGDEVWMGEDCLKEAGATETQDFDGFEDMLREVLQDVGYDESRVIRWESTNYQKANSITLQRAGNITHFWESWPGESDIWNNIRYPNFTYPIFISTGIYFDVNDHDGAYEVYVKTKRLKHLKHHDIRNIGIIAGTFELGEKTWYVRNVVSRLLAASLAVSPIEVSGVDAFYEIYNSTCKAMGFRSDVCNTRGVPTMHHSTFRNDLKSGKKDCTWAVWKNDICDRYTEPAYKEVFVPRALDYKRPQRQKEVLDIGNTRMRAAKQRKEGISSSTISNQTQNSKQSHGNQAIDYLPHLLGTFKEKQRPVYTGIIVNVAKYGKSIQRILDLAVRSVPNLNLLQLRLVDDYGFAYASKVQPTLSYSSIHNDSEIMTIHQLKKLSRYAKERNIFVMPEVSISSTAGGWIHSGFDLLCPTYICSHGKNVPLNINSRHILPIIFSVIEEIMDSTGASLFHLGSDERMESIECFQEGLGTQPKFHEFETELAKIFESKLGLKQSNVIRWMNREEIRYSDRFGAITQCHPGQCRVDGNHSWWLGSVDLQPDDEWEIFKATRMLASRSPSGILANLERIDWNATDADGLDLKLQAFSMGIQSNMSHISEDGFRKLFYPKTNLTTTSSAIIEMGNHRRRTSDPSEAVCAQRFEPKNMPIHVFKNHSIPTARSLNESVVMI